MAKCISKPQHGYTNSPNLFVLSCWCCRCLLFNSIFFPFHSQLTFCVASDTIPTTLTTTTTTSFKQAQGRRNHNTHNLNLKIVIVLIVSAVFLTFLFIMGFIKFLKFKMMRRNSRRVDIEVDGNCSAIFKESVEDVMKNETSGSVWRFSWDEIEKVTKNLSKVIGYGGFSTVYLAHFQSSGVAAVKIHSSSERLKRVFKQELDILLHLHHENIVKLLGYSDDRDEGVLVFEYVPNGTLQEKLHGAKNERILSWKSRMAIAFQLAKAIEYLHEKCTLHIVHGDIKSSNILLDDLLNCKLCDFGSAKMGFSSTVLPRSSMRQELMMGSPGYVDPHYLRTGIASKKNDVYSFGVIVLELMTGIEAFCSEREQMLTSIAGPLLVAGDVAELMDPRLAGDFDLEEVKVMGSMAALCLSQSPSFRPSASDILRIMTEKIPSISFIFEPEKESTKF